MRIQIKYHKTKDTRLEYLLEFLPNELKAYIEKYILDNPNISIDEIRLHANAPLCLISTFKNIKTDYYVSNELIEEALLCFCKGSIYAYFNTIKEGYISLGHGIRVGVCGKATIQDGQITGVSDFSSLNIRMPKRILYAGDYIFRLLQNDKFRSSILLYSSPGVGKTTILRELICKLSRLDDPLRVSVIDSREEMISGIDDTICTDFLLSYPKDKAISLATRTMTPQIIICDEISTIEEAYAVLNSANCGVSFIATTHASSFEELKNKEILTPLFQRNVFTYALGVKREYGSKIRVQAGLLCWKLRMKYLGALFIMCGCVILSYFYESKEKTRLLNLIKIRDFISYVKNQIDFFLTPCHKLFSEYDDDFIKGLIDKDFNNMGIYFEEHIADELSHFFKSLGNGLKDEEISLCDYTIQKLDDMIKKVEGEIKNKIKIFRTLSLFGGGCLVILII